MATVRENPEFSCDCQAEVAQKLFEAMDGCGTSEDQIVEVLVSHNNEQRQIIASAYATAYGKELLDDLKSELSGDLEDSVVALMMKPRDYDAKMLYDSMHGAGTDEPTLIGILCTRNNDEIAEIKDAYQRLYECDLVEDLQADTSGYFQRMMFSLAQGSRQECDEDEDRAQEEAQELVDAGVGALGTDECTFNKILCLDSFPQLRAVLRKYKELREDHSLADDIDSEMSSDLKDGYLSIVKVCEDKYAFFAERLYNAMRGWGTDDGELIRVTMSHCETDLLWIGEKYKEMYEADLFEAVEGECSGYYKSLILSVIAGKYIPKC